MIRIDKNPYYAWRISKKHRDNKKRCVEYKGGKCQNCGYSKCLGSLIFHHLDPTRKEFGISSRTVKWITLKTELDKCILLCSNCHGEIHDQEFEERLKEKEQLARQLVPERRAASFPMNFCIFCGVQFQTRKSYSDSGISKYCSKKCQNKSQETGKWPSDKELQEMVWQTPMTELARLFQVSDKAIKKRCRKKGIKTPTVGYWTRRIRE